MICKKNLTPVNLRDLAENQKVPSVRLLLAEMADLVAVQNSLKILPLSQGLATIIDDSMWESVAALNWYAGWNSSSQSFYPMRGDYSSGWKSGRTMFLHSFIMGFPKDLFIDHKNGNSLDNRQENLRVCTAQQNNFNRRNFSKQSSLHSKFKGVCWHKRIAKWQSNICKNKTKIHLGYFSDEIEAAKAYDRMAVSQFGEFAAPNFPQQPA